ncbi:GAL4 enhancer protein [Tilletia horrida]|uniref:Nascent polypeptide-associated complex subunit alpha n=1 Tax=Tilletia horrida TaxID=155126 RepID=A0AAN6GS89_9BASI|nr:GAL4 enhancer protein [Tilletia horrida]KAK0553916.1 GAL4 enhancer protein [Tilletia horrida]KAK0567468.1 GAL4 enhancer protein [Tilletia horrida]
MASIEEITDEVPDLNVADSSDENENGEVSVPDRIQSRAERKSRKALQNLGLKRVSGINRVTMRRPRGHLVVVQNPEVYKSAYSDVYIVFGEAKNEDIGLQAAQAAAAQQQQQQQAEIQQRILHGADSGLAASLNAAASGKEKADGEAAEEEDDSEPIDETGVDAKDIELVMAQVGCSRRKAVKALKDHNGELIDAIMAAS